MALGKFCDINLARLAALTGGTWALPLTNLQKEEQYVSAPARCDDAADLAKSQFTATLAQPRGVSLVAVLFHTLSIAAMYRLTIAGIDGDLGAPAYVTDWVSVYGAFYPEGTLEWEDENWWTGQISEEEIDLYPRHLWITFPTVLASKVKIEFSDQEHPDGEFDVGGLWIASGFSPEINYERGHELGLNSRDLVDEGPSGRRFAERRLGVRQVTVNWAGLKSQEAQRFFDAGARVGTSQTVIFIPNVDDEPSRIREAFPATFERPPAPRFTYQRANTVAAIFKEIIA